MDNATLTLIISSAVSLVVGLFGKEAWAYFGSKKKTEAETVGVEADNYAKLTKLIKETLEENRKQAAELTATKEEVSQLKMTRDILSGTIDTNNKFMSQVLISHGEMKKSEELCQKRVAELENRVSQLEAAAA